jgi:hypothetical protein
VTMALPERSVPLWLKKSLTTAELVEVFEEYRAMKQSELLREAECIDLRKEAVAAQLRNFVK